MPGIVCPFLRFIEGEFVECFVVGSSGPSRGCWPSLSPTEQQCVCGLASLRLVHPRCFQQHNEIMWCC